MAVRVPNQRLYDTIYQEHTRACRATTSKADWGSAVNFAGQLEGNLLLVHGTGDDNCHYQGTEAAINELVLQETLCDDGLSQPVALDSGRRPAPRCTCGCC